MTDFAEAMSMSGSMAAQTGVSVEELSALIGTAVARTKKSGEEVGTALKSMFVNLQNTGNKKIRTAFESVGISMTQMVNGSEQLKTPIQLLRELSKVYQSLPQGDVKRQNLLTSIGEKRQANMLAAILTGESDYDKMLKDYSEGGGSAFEESQKSANNLEGSINRLSNTWTDLMGNFADAGVLTDVVNIFESLIAGLDKATEFSTSGTVGAITGLIMSLSGKGAFRVDENGGLGGWLGGTIKKLAQVSSETREAKDLFNAYAASGKNLDKTISNVSKNGGLNNFCNQLDITSDSLKKFLGDNSYKKNFEEYQRYLKANGESTTAFAKVTSTAKGIIKGFGATVASMGVSMLAGMAIGAVVNLITDYVNRIKIAQEALDTFYEEYRTQQNDISSQQEWISKNGATYEELAKGVDEYGNSISLTKDQFNQYNSMTKEIADMFPNMIKGYNEQSVAILKNKGSVDELNKSLDENKKKNYSAILSKANETYQQYKTATGGKEENKDVVSKLINNGITSADKTNTYFSLGNIRNDADNYVVADLLSALGDSTKNQLLDEISKLTKGKHKDEFGGAKDIDFSDLSTSLQTKILAVYNEINNTIEKNASKVKPILEAYVYGDKSSYKDLTEEGKNAVKAFVSNVPNEFFDNFDSDVDMGNWVEKNIIGKLKDGLDNGDLAVQIKTLFSLDKTKFSSYSEYVKAVMDIINTIANMTDDKGKKLFSDDEINSYKKKLGVSGVSDDGEINGYSLINKAKDKFSKSKGADEYIDTLSEEDLRIVLKPTINEFSTVEELKAALENVKKKTSNVVTFDSFFNSQDFSKTKEELVKLANAGKLTPDLISSTEKYAEIMTKTKLSAEEICADIMEMVTLSQKLNNVSRDTKKVGSAYKDYKKNGYVSTSSLNSMPDGFKNLGGYSKFSKIASDKKSSKADIQKAFNDIVGKYISTSGVLENVTDKTKKKIVTALHDAGVTNAQEIVNSYSKQQEAQEQAINKATKLDKKYINGKGVDTENFNKQVSVMNAELMNIFGKQYKTDVENFTKSLKAKAKAYNKFITAYNEASPDVQKVYDNQKKIAKGKKKATPQDFKDFANLSFKEKVELNLVNDKGEEYDDAEKAYQKLKKALTKKGKKITTKFDTNFNPTTSSGSGSSSSKSKSDTKQTFDWIAVLLDRVADKADKAREKVAKLFTYGKKENAITKALKQTQKELNVTEKVGNKYLKLSKGVNISSSLKKKVRDGDYSVSEYGSGTAKKIEKYKNYYEKYLEMQEKAVKAQEEIDDLRMDSLENLIDKHDKIIAKAQQKVTNVTNSNDLATARGKELSKSNLSSVLSAEKSNYKVLSQALADYQKKLKKLTAGGISNSERERYEKLNETITNVKTQLNESAVSQAELNKQIADLPIEKADSFIAVLDTLGNKLSSITDLKTKKGIDLSANDIQSQIDTNNEQIEQIATKLSTAKINYSSAYLSGNTANTKEYQKQINEYQTDINNLLMSNEDLTNSLYTNVYNKQIANAITKTQELKTILDGVSSLVSDDTLWFDDKGDITEYGAMYSSTLIKSYENARNAVDAYSNSYNTLTEQYKNGEISKAYYDEQSKTALDGTISSLQEMKTVREQLISLIEVQGKKELDSIFEQIDARTKLLAKQKEANSYANSIKEKTTEIKLLRAQAAAIGDIDDATVKANKRRIEASLADANDQLQELQIEHEIDLITDGLEDFKITLQDTYDENIENIKSSLDNIDSITKEVSDLFVEKFGDVETAISSMLAKLGVSGEANKTLTDGENLNTPNTGVPNVSHLSSSTTSQDVANAKSTYENALKKLNNIKDQINEAQDNVNILSNKKKQSAQDKEELALWKRRLALLQKSYTTAKSELSRANELYSNAKGSYKKFHTGGVIDISKNEANITVANKERVLTQAQNRSFEKLISMLPSLNDKIESAISNGGLKQADFGKIATINDNRQVNVNYDSLITVNGDMVDLDKTTENIIRRNMGEITNGVSKGMLEQLKNKTGIR